MGLYDNIEVDSEILDVNGDWQTKSLYSSMETYRITKEGRLLKIRRPVAMTEEEIEEAEPSFGIKPFMKMQDCAIDTHHHGAVQFYDMIDDKWREYLAVFEEGQLQSVTKIHPRK